MLHSVVFLFSQLGAGKVCQRVAPAPATADAPFCWIVVVFSVSLALEKFTVASQLSQILAMFHSIASFFFSVIR
jgi:hypothetical protein